MKKLKILLILFLMFFGINSIKAFDNTLKIYDYAQELTSIEEESLKIKVDEYINKYNMDMVLVTVKYHQKETTRDYAMDFYDYNNFGINETKDGILFVIDFTFGYRDIEIVTTGEAIRMYDDYRINKMLDNISYNSNKSYNIWFETFIDDASYYASLGVPSSNIGTTITPDGDIEYTTLGKLKMLPWQAIIITSLVIPSIIILILVFKNKMVKPANNANIYIKEGSLVINNKSDKFITTHTTKVRINDSSSSSGSGGGRIGGSSISRGSSGRSHGGGGRRL